MHQIRAKRSELIGHPAFMPAQQRITIEIVVHRKRRQASFKLQRGDGFLLDGPRHFTAVNATEGKLLALRKCGELPAERGHPVRLVEGIGEESDT